MPSPILRGRRASTAPESIRVIATSAARDAVNPDDLISAIEAASKLKVEIISGAQEAEWAFQGVTTDPDLAKAPLLLLDVGGGSTEFILGRGEHKHFAHSFPLGTVRLLEKFPHSDPPARGEFTASRDWLRNFLQTEVRPELEPALHRESGSKPGEIQLVGTGGTTSILARMEAKLDRYDRERLEATRLSLEQVKAHRKRLWSLPLAERKEIVGLPSYPCRCDSARRSDLRSGDGGIRFQIAPRQHPRPALRRRDGLRLFTIYDLRFTI